MCVHGGEARTYVDSRQMSQSLDLTHSPFVSGFQLFTEVAVFTVDNGERSTGSKEIQTEAATDSPAEVV